MDNDFVKNPQTGKAIKVGSVTYNKLVKQGIFNGEISKQKRIISFQNKIVVFMR